MSEPPPLPPEPRKGKSVAKIIAILVCVIVVGTIARGDFEQTIKHVGKSENGKAAVSQLAGSVPASVLPWIVRADRHESQGHLQDAISDFKEAIKLDPHNVLCWLNLGRLFDETQQYDKAVAAFSKLLEFEPSNFQARFLRANLYRRLGAHAKAMADASEVIRLHPERSEGYSIRAMLYNLDDDYKNAMADADRAIQINPRDLDAYFARGLAHLRLKHYDQAVQDLTKGLKLVPNDGTAWLNRATAFVYLRKYKEAVADLVQASKHDPKSTSAFNGLAWLLATCPDSTVRNGRKANEYISRALELHPNQWKLWDTRAAVFAENSDFGNAVRWEERCLERKDLSEAERHRISERLVLYRAGKPSREQPK